MILLSGHSLTEARRVQAETMSLQLKERDSTASITLPGNGSELDGIAIGKWLMDDTDPGEGIVWQVRSVQQAFNRNTPTVQLEHVISTLKDRIMFGEVTPATITGTAGATTCTARQAVEYILDQQSDWELGDFDYNSVSNPYKFDGDTLFEALETVTDSLEDAYWTYDMSSYPFTLNIVQKSAEVDSELRAGRNMRTVSRTIDKSGMYTRFYPIGADDLHITAEYVERNATTYGVISKVETDSSISTEAELIRWANERLKKHAEPVVTVTVEGLELSRETGEDLDSLTIGRVCRIPLPEYSTTIQERITELNYQDKINQPEVVRITMANVRNDVTKIISDMIRKSGRGGRASARKDKEDHAWFEDTNDHVAMVAEGIIGVDAAGNPNWTRLSEFIADGEGLHAKVETQMAGVTDRVATLEINENEIRTEVREAKSDIYTYIDQTAEGIEIAAAASSSTIYSVIETTATNIKSEVVRRTRVFVQITDPALVPGNNIREGDIWVKSIKMKTWSEMSSKTWESSADFNWNQYSGSPQFVWDGTKWEEIGNEGVAVEYGTRIDQTERNISLIARAIGAVDPSAIAEIDISAEAINSAVSTAKSELYSIIRQTATNITSQVVNDISGISSYVEQTASSMTQAIARKNKVFVQLTDPANYTGVTVIEGDIWIKSAGNDNVKQTWTELSAKTWSSQNSTNWREYYEGYWYVRKNNKWEIMNADADVVEIGTKLEQDEKHIALIARDVDENHQELGARLQVTAREIRGEVHAAKSSLYSTIVQTATSIRAEVVDIAEDLNSSITQTASSIRSEVNAAKSTIYSSITQTASQIRAEVSNVQAGLNSSITQTASSIRSEVNAAKSTIYSSITQTASSIRSEVASTASSLSSSITQTASQIRSEVSSTASGLQSQITQNAGNIELKVSKNGVISSINQTSEEITINAAKINLNGYVKATDITADLIKSKISLIDTLAVGYVSVGSGKSITLNGSGGSTEISFASIINVVKDLRITSSGNTYTLQKKNYNGGTNDWVDVGNFSRAVASWTMGWSGGTFTAKANPQNQSCSTQLVQGSTTWGTDNPNTANVSVDAFDSDNPSYQYATGRNIFVDATARYNAGWRAYYDKSEWWQSPIGHSGVCKIPKRDASGSETWFTMSSISMTRAGWHSVSGNIYKGKLYYWDDDTEDYEPVVNSAKYWYYSDSSKSGTTTFYY